LDAAKGFPLKDRVAGVVTCCLVLDHVADVDGWFREMARVCAPDGRVVVSVMHPAMMLRGVQARFTDPETGRRIYPASVANQFSDFVMGASRAGLVFEHFSEHVIDDALVARSPRAARHLGWPLLVLMRLRPST